MAQIKIYLSPSDQTSNAYAYGNTTEAIQCRRIADALEVALKRCGFEVKNNKSSSMAARVAESNSWDADLHVPLHTNAFNGKVSGTRIFTYDTAGKGYQCAKKVFAYLAPTTPGASESISADATLYEVRFTTAPCVYIESEFHDVAIVAKWIIEHVEAIAEAICRGICDYFGVAYKAPATPKPATTEATDVCKVELHVLRKGAESGYVKTLQILLNKYNNAGLAEDGAFGAKTEAAVRAYQKDRKLDVDGIAGVQTWAQLLK